MLKLYIIFNYIILINKVFVVFYIIIFSFSGLTKYIKNIFEQNLAKGSTGFKDDKYGFIDEPIYRDALLVLKET